MTHDVGKHIHHFHGGLRLRHNKKVSCQLAVQRPPLPELVTVPLLQHAGDIASPLVRVGDPVLKGQQIGQCQPCAAVHSPVSGIVELVEDRPMSHPSGQAGPCVVIRPDGSEQWIELKPISNWRTASADSLIAQFQDCGLAGLGGAVFPTHAKARDGRKRKIHTLVLNGIECEPYISCDEMLMREQPDKIILGARILRRALGARRVIIAIEDQMGAVQEALTRAAECTDCENISVIKVPMIYPEGSERQLIQVLTGLEVPAGGRPSDLGMVCQNVATAAAVADAVVEGKPLIERYITVTGNGITQPRNFQALFGTSFSHLVEACGGYANDVARLVVGGPMMGYPVSTDETPVVKRSNCILALSNRDIAEPQPEMPCIRCGECARVCPATLLPQQLHLQIRNGLWEQAEEYGLSACIECGCCDYVCPGHIPLVEWFRFGKSEQQQRALESEASLKARKRFKDREARLLRVRQERTEKMARRKKMLKDKSSQQDRIRASIDRAKSRIDLNQSVSKVDSITGTTDDT
ncbi:MAG: electron transport complex subunit RsxC [Gammaproteobacteria bacterium]|nr:electron transport complex subunit RsxC [Gammaproteobacteria bacterium]